MVLKRKWFVSRSVADDSAMSCFENRKKTHLKHLWAVSKKWHPCHSERSEKKSQRCEHPIDFVHLEKFSEGRFR